MSFGGRLVQIRAIRARNSERRVWSSAEEFDRGGCALAGPEDKRGGSGAKWFSVEQYGKCFFLKSLLHLTEL
jgi:hypothetical protein